MSCYCANMNLWHSTYIIIIANNHITIIMGGAMIILLLHRAVMTLNKVICRRSHLRIPFVWHPIVMGCIVEYQPHRYHESYNILSYFPWFPDVHDNNTGLSTLIYVLTMSNNTSTHTPYHDDDMWFWHHSAASPHVLKMGTNGVSGVFWTRNDYCLLFVAFF